MTRTRSTSVVRPTSLVGANDPWAGRHLAPDGQLFAQAFLAAGAAPKSWKDLLPT
ncbi:hypothetical protein [Mycobacterium sp.]|uniref:hypothetical protein n=1 Tax=Mycobacterium sp. TaxID=1785 RepID=UPI003C72040C